MENKRTLCKLHSRPYEGFCANCLESVCPSCVIFGAHKKHDILSLDEASMKIRESMDKLMRRGVLKHEYSEERALKLKEKKLELLLAQKNALNKVENMNKELYDILITRKSLIIDQLVDLFQKEKDKLNYIEQELIKKKKAQISLDKKKNSTKNELINKTKEILKEVKTAKGEKIVTGINVYNNIDNDFIIDIGNGEEKKFCFEDFIASLEEFLKCGDPFITFYKG